MMASVSDFVWDPTLYRVFALGGWFPRDSVEDSNRRLGQLAQVLQNLGWMPEDVQAPRREELVWMQRKLWDVWTPNSIPGSEVLPATADGIWRMHRFAQAYHESLIVFLGAEQDGQHAWPEWTTEATARADALTGITWRSQLAPPDEANSTRFPLVLGDSSVWTGEWESEPESGWATFGRERYGRVGFALFDWGVLGYQLPSEADGQPTVELHVTRAQAVERDRFLFSSLTVLLIEFLKATRLLQTRYQSSLGPSLDELERGVLAAAEPKFRAKPADLRATENGVIALSGRLFDFARDLADLEDDARGVEVARDSISGVLDRSGAIAIAGLDGRWWLDPVEWLAHQMRTDIAFYRTAEERGNRALETRRTLVEIERTRVEQLLIVVLAVVGAVIGLGQLLGEGVSLALRLLLALGATLVVVLSATAYWVWSRRRVADG